MSDFDKSNTGQTDIQEDHSDIMSVGYIIVLVLACIVLSLMGNGCSAIGYGVGSAFDWPVILRPWIAASVDSLGWNHYMAFDGETAVATAAFFISGDQTWFGMASTLPEYRKQGAQGGLIERRLRDVNALGCKQIVVETAEETPTHEAPSYRNMHRYGFHLAYLKQNHIWNPD